LEGERPFEGLSSIVTEPHGISEFGPDNEWRERDLGDLSLIGSFDRISLLGMYRRLSCAIQDDLEHSKGTIYKTHEYDLGHSLSYFKPETVAFVRTELADFIAQFGHQWCIALPVCLAVCIKAYLNLGE
jgi:hypothetical protein